MPLYWGTALLGVPSWPDQGVGTLDAGLEELKGVEDPGDVVGEERADCTFKGKKPVVIINTHKIK